jgi:cytochrome c peroxidase
MDTGDGLSLPVGEGGKGLGATRDTGKGGDAIRDRVPRNAPPIFALGSKQVTRLFHDGRVEADSAYPGGFKSPPVYELPEELENIPAVQAMFTVTSYEFRTSPFATLPCRDRLSVSGTQQHRDYRNCSLS